MAYSSHLFLTIHRPLPTLAGHGERFDSGVGLEADEDEDSSLVAILFSRGTIGPSTTVLVWTDLHPILDTSDATLGNTLSANETANIPLNGRKFSALTLFIPGAIDTDPTGLRGNNAIERNTFNNGQVEINGNRTQENNYTIEGA